MASAALIRLAIISVAVAWTAFAGMMAGEAAFWPSAFVGSIAGLVAFFWLLDWTLLNQDEPAPRSETIIVKIERRP